jgi:hypothetical protein
MSKQPATHAEPNKSALIALSFRRGFMAAATVGSIPFGLKMLGVTDLWCLVAAISIVAAWVVGYGAAIVYLLNDSE